MTTFVQSRDVQQILDNLGLHFIERFAGRRVLVSGGLGFLGRYFAAVFQAMNDGPLQGREVEVRLVDNCIASGAAAAPTPTRWITSLKADVAELREPYGGLDYVLHCAGIASPFYYRRFPLETVDAALSVRSVLEVARRNAGCRVAFFSSSEIYGDPDPKHVPTPESYRGNVSCLGPRSVYDESKRIPAAVRRTRNDHPSVQRLRSRDAAHRLSRLAELRGAHPQGRARPRVRRRTPDANLLLRERRDRRLPARAARRHRRRAVQHRQPDA